VKGFDKLSPNGPEIGGLGAELRARAATGALALYEFMAAANAHYYATRDPLGAGGDFTTAPEISQMFGELVGIWLSDLWLRAGQPAAHYVELGPGRGTLAADALRAMGRLGFEPPAHLVETSPRLRQVQATRVPRASWHDHVDTLPTDGPLLIVANEFFDALPIRQYVATDDGWRERGLEPHGDGWRWTLLDEHAALSPAPPGSVAERNEAGEAVVAALAAHLRVQGGALLVIDYGHTQPALGDTLQAVRAHAFADVLASPGEVDLTAHVDFSALAGVARGLDLAVHGPVPQGGWLRAMGIGLRTARLAAASPGRTGEIAAARDRLISPDQMGALFKVMAVTAPGWPEPAGFA